MTDMNAYIKNQAEKIDNRLEEHLKLLNHSVVTEAMTYSVKNGGKRIRPFLTLEFAKACGGNMDAALEFGCAVEMIHTYSLIHDDLPCMDNDDMRRGKPSCHKAFDEATALLAGDALLTNAFLVLSSTNISNDNRLSAIETLSINSGCIGMIGGQALDLDFENREPTADEILKMYELKTGRLLEAACKLGCLSNNYCLLKDVLAAEEYAKNLGLAFQIQDDILDITSDEATLGKPVGSDEKNDKSTIVKHFGIEKSKDLVREYTDKAIASLGVFNTDTETLKQLSFMLVDRKN